MGHERQVLKRLRQDVLAVPRDCRRQAARRQVGCNLLQQSQTETGHIHAAVIANPRRRTCSVIGDESTHRGTYEKSHIRSALAGTRSHQKTPVRIGQPVQTLSRGGLVSDARCGLHDARCGLHDARSHVIHAEAALQLITP